MHFSTSTLGLPFAPYLYPPSVGQHERIISAQVEAGSSKVEVK